MNEMTAKELLDMTAQLREMFDEYLATLDQENSEEFYGTAMDMADREFKRFLKWLSGPGTA